MNGELLPVWARTWQEIWLRLAKSQRAPADLFVELVRNVAPAPRQPTQPPAPSTEAFNSDGQLIDSTAIQLRSEYEAAMESYSAYRNAYETALNSEADAREFFHRALGTISSELEATNLLEIAYETLVAYGDDRLTSRFRKLVGDFIVSFNLRYELREKCSLHPTLPGVFAKLISEVRKVADQDSHLNDLLTEFEEAFADLKTSRSQSRMKTCLQKQYNLLEALGRRYPGVTETTLGAICNQLDWPHAAVKEVGKKLYGFGSNYPGVRHAGNTDGVMRQLNMKDFVSLSLMLASFTPYVTSGLNSDLCYSA